MSCCYRSCWTPPMTRAQHSQTPMLCSRSSCRSTARKCESRQSCTHHPTDRRALVLSLEQGRAAFACVHALLLPAAKSQLCFLFKCLPWACMGSENMPHTAWPRPIARQPFRLHEHPSSSWGVGLFLGRNDFYFALAWCSATLFSFVLSKLSSSACSALPSSQAYGCSLQTYACWCSAAFICDLYLC